MTEKTLTTENIKPALDALRGELAPWPVVAKKQDRLNDTQKSAVNSGITSSLVAQIIANTAAIRALESAITGTGLRALVVSSLPAIGTQGILYIVPVTTYDPDTDADVVNYSNEYIWIPVEGGTASEGHYEQVGQTGIVINNGQLNITVNGTSVGTFTANQSGDTTAAITVPTNADYVDKTTAQTAAGVKTFSDGIVSNVTGNVTGDLTGTASKAIADEDGTSIKTGYVNVAGNQTVSGDKSWTGSNTFNSILPNATNTYSLGSSSYQWSAVYAQTYYYNGTEFSSKFVTTDTNQTISGDKTWTGSNAFTNNLLVSNSTNKYLLVQNTNNDWVLGSSTPSSTKELGGVGYRDKNGNTTFYCLTFHDASGNVYTRLNMRWRYTNGVKSTSGSNINTIFELGLDNTGNTYVSTNGSWKTNLTPYASATYDLGTSTNKWKTLNGVNPGALSLPAINTSIAVDTTNWVYDGATFNEIKINNATQTISGWLYIIINNASSDDVIVVRYAGSDSGNLTYAQYKSGLSYVSLVAPIMPGVKTYVASRKAFSTIKIYPCLGNV